MVFQPSVRIIFLSFFMGVLVLSLFLFFNRPEFQEAYGVLAVDEALPDRQIGDLLRTSGFEEFYSESTAKIFIDDFGQPREIYLDQYRLEAFDPRENGYAGILRSFFVNNGIRYFFIPLGFNVQYYYIERRMNAAMGAIPFALEVLGSSRPMFLWFIFLLAAMIITLIISKDRLRFILQIPILLTFAWEGLPGLILAGLLVGLWELLREPLHELSSSRPYGGFKERLRPFRYSFFWAFFLFFLFIALFLIWMPSFIPIWFGFLCFLLLECLSFKQIKRKKRRNMFFMPVMINTFPKNPKNFRLPIMIFSLSSLLALTFLFFFPEFAPELFNRSRIEFDNLPLAIEYEEHMVFQASFSMNSLFAYNGEQLHTEYLRYFLGDDGLIAGTVSSIFTWEIPPFPLEKLSTFLLNYRNETFETPEPMLKDWIIVSLITIFCIPYTYKEKKIKRKDKKILLPRNPGIAA